MRMTKNWEVDQSIDSINIILVIYMRMSPGNPGRLEHCRCGDFSRQACGFTCTYRTIGFSIEQNPKLGVDNWYPPVVNLQKAIEHGPKYPEIVDLPIKNGRSFHSKMWQFTRPGTLELPPFPRSLCFPPGRKRPRCHRDHVWRRGSALGRCG